MARSHLQATSRLANRARLGVIVMLTGLAGALACTEPTDVQSVASIVVIPDSFDLALTTTRTITAQLVGPNGEAVTRTIAWSSSNPSIAAVSATGTVTPIALGLATITISAGGKSVQVKVRVVQEPVVSVRITPQQAVHIVRVGQSVQLGAECLNGASEVLPDRSPAWNSSNPVIASVTSTGLVTGLAVGNATISASCNNVVGTTVAQVTLVPVSSIAVTPPQMNLLVGQQQQLSVTALDSANNLLSTQGRVVTWTSDNLPVATVSSQGVVVGVSAGNANVRVNIDGVLSPVVPVGVQQVPVAAVTVSPANVRVGFGVTMQAQCRDSQNNILTGRVITWVSGQPGIATINPGSGVAQGVSVGIATITATCEGVVGSAPLTVTP
jgi:uncharacterized protein YjdB